MKVLHVIPSLAPSYGGPRQTVLEFCQHSRDQRWQSEICATDADGSGHLNVELNLPVLYEGVASRFFRFQGCSSLHYSRPIKRWLDENVARYDVVHLNGIFSYTTYVAATACSRQDVPYVISPHGMLEPWSMRQKRLRKLVAWHAGFRRLIRNAAAIHYTTDQERTLTENSLHLRNGIVIPLGIEESLLQRHQSDRFRQEFGIPHSSPFLLALSRIHPKKGIDLLLRGFVDLKSQGRLADWHLVIAGSGEPGYVEQLQGLTRHSSAAPFLHWVGWLQGETKYAALCNASLFVLSSFQENFGIAVAEAMACGTPVLVSRQVGLAATIEAHNAGWVVNLNSDELRATLSEVLRDPVTLQARGLAARRLVAEEFAWSKIVARWITTYDSLADRFQTKRDRWNERSFPANM